MKHTLTTRALIAAAVLGVLIACGGDNDGAKSASCGNGQVESGEACDGEPCCTTTCTFAVPGTECRKVAGTCDVAESCDGQSAQCPPDAFVVGGTVCHPASCPDPGACCDAPETCTGTGPACPADQGPAPPTQVCRPAASGCDVPEACNGFDRTCPPDTGPRAPDVKNHAIPACTKGVWCGYTSEKASCIADSNGSCNRTAEWGDELAAWCERRKFMSTCGDDPNNYRAGNPWYDVHVALLQHFCETPPQLGKRDGNDTWYCTNNARCEEHRIAP
jgi:hypothetical protein